MFGLIWRYVNSHYNDRTIHVNGYFAAMPNMQTDYKWVGQRHGNKKPGGAQGISRPIICTLCKFPITNPSNYRIYMRQWNGTTLVQIIACRLFRDKPLPKPTLTYCQLDAMGQALVIFSFMKMHLKTLSPQWRPFCPGYDKLKGGTCTQR